MKYGRGFPVFKAAALMVFAFLLSGCGERGGDLSLRFPEGKTFAYTITTEQNVSEELTNREINFKQTLILKNTFTVDSVHNDRAVLNFDFSFLDFSIENNPSNVKANYKQFLDKVFKGDVVKNIKVTVNNRGTVLKVEGYTEYTNKVIKRTESLALPESIMQSLLPLLDKNKMLDNFSGLFSYIPEKLSSAARISDEWETAARKSGGSLPVSVRSKWKISDLTPSQINLKSTGTIKLGKKSLIFKVFKGIQSSIYCISRKDGWPLSIQTEQVIQAELNSMPYSDKVSPVSMQIKTFTGIKRIQ